MRLHVLQYYIRLNLRYIVVILVLGIAMLYTKSTLAQSNPHDTINAYAYVLDGDTVPMFFIGATDINEFVGNSSRKKELDKLRYRVYRVYPYAVLAANVLKKMDQELGTNPSRRAKKKYIDNLDLELNSKFKNELKQLSEEEGRILVRLVNRQTGRRTYDIIKELKGGLNARMYQTAFSMISNDLKSTYDPYGKDKDVEMIVQELEARKYSQYMITPKAQSPKK